MSGERDFGRLAAIGGTAAAAILLLTGIAAARADELSDLRAKEQQLQQQLDQLQGVSPVAPDGSGSGGAPPGRPAVVVGSFPRSFMIPGTDTSVSVSGSVQTNFGFGKDR
jgi:hypothetical protein